MSLLPAVTCAAEEAQWTPDTPIVLEGMVPQGTPLVGHLMATRDGNSDVMSALSVCRAAGMDAEAVRRAFRAPTLNASIGLSEDPSDVPNGSFSTGVASDSASVQAGVEAPLVTGVYGGVGARHQVLRTGTETDGEDRDAVGGYLRVPLGKDFGFAQNRFEVETLTHEEQVAIHQYRAALYDAWTAVTDAYAQYLFRIADATEVSNALSRAEQLVEDATERARLEDVAEYQVYPARYEAATRAEELAEAKTQILVARETLRQAVGMTFDETDTLAASPEAAYAFLSAWVEALNGADLSEVLAADPEKTCHEVLSSQASYQAALSRSKSAEEAEAASLDLNLGAGWHSEEDDTTLNETGYTVSLVYARPLSRGGSRAKIDAAKYRVDAAMHDYAAAVLKAKVRREKAVAALESVRGRCRQAKATVEAARQVLESENERFAIGDGSSRNVLDAQKDLTTARRRELSVSLEVVTAMAELYRASGLPPSIMLESLPL